MEGAMTELGREAKALVEAASGGDEPTDENRARVRAAIGAQLVAAAAAGATLASAKSSAAAGSAVPVGLKTLTLVSLALVTAAGVGTVIYVRSTAAIEAGPPAAVRTTTSDPASPAAPAPALTDSAPPAAVLPPAEPAATEKRRPMPPPSAMPARARGATASVEAEMGLIGEAREALRSGEGARALLLLDEHAHRYPAGALGEERDAMRVASLCALGRVAEARAAASQFLRAFPESPHAARVRASCASDPDSPF
jgi:hypothetical protein